MINRELKEEIYLKFEKLKDISKYSEDRRNFIIKSLNVLGDLYSFWIENPDLRKSLLLENKSPKTIKKLARKGLHGIKNAWDYVSNISKESLFIDEFNEDIIRKTNNLIEPKIRYSGDFRGKDVSLGIKNYTPPSFERVPEKVSNSIREIKEIYNIDPLEGSIKTHLDIAAIQPFMDGNKRTARLLQNKLLFDARLPPVLIPAGEAKFYFGVLKEVLPFYEENNLDKIKPFYDYCASKINNGLDDILGDLKI